jgi:Cof subfamily protein (haloacid dehalogenase superfamily)
MRHLASKYHLLISGGSDFHGTNKPNLDLGTGYGKLCIPYEILANIKKYRRQNGKYRNRIIFADMDGTLLDDEKKLSAQIFSKIMDFTSQGGHFVLSSGRPLASILETADRLSLNLPGTYIIAYNGALIYDCEQQCSIWEQRIPYDYVAKVMEVAKECGVHAQTYNDDTILSPADDDELAQYLQHIHMPVLITEDIVSALEQEPFKLILIHLKQDGKLELFRNALAPWAEGKMHTFYSSPIYLECCMLKASKGNAVEFLCSHLGLDIRDSLAAGDAANDISMLQTAGIGICMCNGTEDTKAASDYITKADNNHEGFLEIFEILSRN